MSKPKLKDQDETTVVAVTQQAGLPVGLDIGSLQQDAGAGSQNISAEDTQTPIISILQANSPQCKKSDGKYIKGAEEGKLYNNVTQEIYDGDQGITIVPCFFEKVYIEWKPNRGGLAGIHPATTPLKDQVKLIPSAENPDKLIPVLPNGNVLNETNQHFVLILKPDGGFEPAVLAMTSSALRSSRQLNTLIKRVMLTGPNGMFNPASYYNQFRLSTAPRQSGDYSWFGWQIEALGPVQSNHIYNAGKALEQAVNAGAVRVKQEEVEVGSVINNETQDDEIPF